MVQLEVEQEDEDWDEVSGHGFIDEMNYQNKVQMDQMMEMFSQMCQRMEHLETITTQVIQHMEKGHKVRELRTERSRTPPPRNLSDRILFVEPKCDGIEMVLDVQPRDVHLQKKGRLGCWVCELKRETRGGSGVSELD